MNRSLSRGKVTMSVYLMEESFSQEKVLESSLKYQGRLLAILQIKHLVKTMQLRLGIQASFWCQLQFITVHSVFPFFPILQMRGLV